ncbi:MAG: glycosyltransferase family A protein [bacterium]|nr:glycosyltransferase family A protein [bacterium]
MSRGFISIIIPAYNAERTIEKCLASIFAQTFREFTVIVVDDGSTDKTLETMERAISRLRNREIVLSVVSQENRGAQAARNKGWQEIQKCRHSERSRSAVKNLMHDGTGSFAAAQDDKKCNYILFCDADIVLRPDCLEKMVRTLEAHPDASYAYSSFRFGWKKFKLWPFSAARLKQMPYIHTTSLIRVEHFPETGWDESVKRLQDWDLWLTMLEQWHIGVWIPKVLFTVVNTKGTMSRWIPSFLHAWPFKRLTLQVEPFTRYNEAVARIKEKHRIVSY